MEKAKLNPSNNQRIKKLQKEKWESEQKIKTKKAEIDNNAYKSSALIRSHPLMHYQL